MFWNQLPWSRGRWAVRVVATLAALLPTAVPATTLDETEEPSAVHGQLTFVEQETNGFATPYRGANSLSPVQGRETVDATLYLGVRLAPDTEAWLTPEVDQGAGLDNTLGVAGFPSGEAYKVGRAQPYLRLPRAFVRTSFGGHGDVAIEPGPIQLGGHQHEDRLVLTVGKFSVTDVFDGGQYAHDPRGDFFNWTAIDAGTFDYAADAWGYTIGAAIEAPRGAWTARAGLFDLSDVPNSAHLTPGGHQFEWVGELERRHRVGAHGGRLLVTGYDNRGRMARLEDALRAGSIASVRAYRSRTGASLLIEQDVDKGAALLARAGVASGNVEAYEFTDIDRTLAAGVSVAGLGWARARDVVGVIAIRNQISDARVCFLAAGGLGILIGDGRLPHPGQEGIVEAYYRWALVADSHLTLDWQRVSNPAYNRDRGPVTILAVRLHAQF